MRPSFGRTQVEVGNHLYGFFYRDIIMCIRALFGNPEFAPYLVFKPQKHFSDDKHTNQLYHGMHTGEWWWETPVN